MTEQEASSSAATVQMKQPSTGSESAATVEHELVGLTVSDGFKFGCGFVLASIVGLLGAMIVVTTFLAVGILLGIRLPIFG